MPTVEIIGIPQSTYVRAIRIACAEKGVPYDLLPARPQSPEVRAIHPFGKVPAFRHGDFELCESSAIARYLDAVFDGPALFPADPRTAALAEEWLSLVNTHMDHHLIRRYLFAYLFPGTPDKSPDRAAIDAMLPDVRAQLALLDKAVARTGFLAGDSFTFADANVMPILAYLRGLPESSAAIESLPHLRGYFERNATRASFVASAPQQAA